MTRKSLTSVEINDKKKTLKKLAIPAVAIIALFLLIQVMKQPYYDWKYKNHEEEFQTYINKLMQENNSYIKELAAKIKSTQLSPGFLSQVQSEIIFDRQKPGAYKRYVWMSGVNDDLIFGLPKEDFAVLNARYQKYSDVIEYDGYYKSRNDFFDKLIDVQDKLNLNIFNNGIANEDVRNVRFYHFADAYKYFRPYFTTFSTQVFDNEGKFLGVLYMKVNDLANENKYFSQMWQMDFYWSYQSIVQISAYACLIALLFLWFLLPTWVYADAELRGVKRPLSWVILTVTTFVFGLIIYIIIRPSTGKTLYCPKCFGELDGTNTFCPHCGYDISTAYCRECNYPIKDGWKYCPECRTEINRKNKYILPPVQM
jgi:hypothetical protein